MIKPKLKLLAVALSCFSAVPQAALADVHIGKEFQIEVMSDASRVAYTAEELGLDTPALIAIEILDDAHQRVGLLHIESPLYLQFEEFEEQTGEFVAAHEKWFEQGMVSLDHAQQATLEKGSSVRFYSLNEAGEVIELLMLQPKRLASLRTRSVSTSAYKFIDNGSPNEKIDLVLLGDGYTAGEKEKFRSDAKLITDGFFAKSPYRDYRDYFNVWLIEKASQQSGIGIGSPLDGSAFKSYFPDSSSRLLLLKDRFVSLNEAKAVLPESATEIFLVVSNTEKYGGVGYGNVATMSTHSSAVGLALHEVGHTFGKLADEYSYGNCNLNGEPSAKNVTMQTSNVKWSHWMAHDHEVGLFEGAQYCATGKYRPTKNSLMRALGTNLEFGSVNSEALILKMYETISPVASVSPSSSTVALESERVFSVSTPIPTDRVAIQWSLNGDVLLEGDQAAITVNPTNLDSGSHVLKVVVKDTTEKVKRDPSNRLISERQWQLNVADDPQPEPQNRYRYARFVIDSEIKGQDFASAAELTFVDQTGSTVSPDNMRIVSVSSQETQYPRPASNAIDGDPDTFWHSRWSQSPLGKAPHEIIIDLGQSVALSRVEYLPRQDGNVNGTAKDYRLYLSNTVGQWASPVDSGSFAPNTEEKVMLVESKGEENQAPNAIVSRSQGELTGSGSVTLIGEKSNDPDGDGLVYQWQQTSPKSPLAVIESPKEANTQVRFAGSTSEVTYRFILTVSDGELSDSAEAVITQKAEATQSSPKWDAGKTYATPCERVSWKENEWENQWWTQGTEPGSDGTWGVWRKVNTSNNQCS